MRVRLLAATLWALALGMAGQALAQVTTCSSTGAAVSMGTYTSYQPSDLDSSFTVAVTCARTGGPGNTTVTLTLGPSATSGSINPRQLRGATDVLPYNFYRDTARQLVLGSTIGVNALSQTRHIKNNTSEPFIFTVFGRIPALQDIAAGAYQDSLLMTVNF